MSITYAGSRGTAETQPVAWLRWDNYLEWLSGRLTSTVTAWGEDVRLPPAPQPGEHEANVGPTGEGKSTHVVGRLSARSYVLALDPKGHDETLTASGYLRVQSIWQDSLRWRMRHREDARTWDRIWKAIDGGRPARVIVGGPADSRSEVAQLKALMREAVEFCQFVHGWSMYVDELELMTSPEMFALRRFINEMLIAARRGKTSVITSYQAQAWVSKHPIRQARRCTIWPTGDVDMIAAVARGMGRDWRDLREAVELLPPWHTLTIPRGKHHPMIITSAPKLA